MKNVLQFLEDTAFRFPEKIAVRYEEQKINYKDLMTESKIVGSFLAGQVLPKQPIIVLMDKKIEALTAFFGIVYAGCFYININPHQPIERIKKMIDILNCELIITDESCNVSTLNYQGEIIQYEEMKTGIINELLLANIRSKAQDVDPLYCNFTSVTTGIPKGVLVSHRSVIDFIDHFTEIFNITDEDVIGNQAPFDFDVSVKDIYSCLKTGATLVILPKKYFSVIMLLLDCLEKYEVTTLIWAVSALCFVNQFKGFRYKVPQSINKVLFSGEIMPIQHLNEWMTNIPKASYVNLYGPTEITCNCTYFPISRKYSLGEQLPIGNAFPNRKVFLLTKDNEMIKEKNKVGEICVSGTCLALGYYNNKEQTNLKFVEDPTNEKYSEVIYRTGDLGYCGDDDNFYFSGRVDFQIKHLGHRIELEEIETMMYSLPEISRCSCLYDEINSRIVTFCISEISPKDIKKKLMEKLPMYMIPSKIYLIEKMPLTINGKINRKELKYYYEREGI